MYIGQNGNDDSFLDQLRENELVQTGINVIDTILRPDTQQPQAPQAPLPSNTTAQTIGQQPQAASMPIVPIAIGAGILLLLLARR